MAYLTGIGVKYVVVHRSFYQADAFDQLIARMTTRADLQAEGQYRDPQGECRLFVLR